ncbi:MAG: DUF4154 domain-containing protein [Bacteroidales bacterium]|nr:DUF4154 domain-containing protein [Bacteroidales bacterium]
MKNNLTKHIFILFLFLTISINIFSQSMTLAKNKAVHIYVFGNYINWENIDSIKTFKIGIYGNDTELYNELNKITKNKFLKGKPIEILLFEKFEEIENTQILYVSPNRNNEINNLLHKKNTLLITVNNKYETSMINFLFKESTLKFEINEKNIEQENLTILPKLLAMVKTKSELQELYIKTEEILENERKQIELQKKKITEQAETISLQKNEIEKKKTTINKQEEKIVQQKSRINRQNIVLENQKKDITQQQENIIKKNLVLKKQEDEIKLQKTNIQKQQKLQDSHAKILNQQKNAIEKQQNNIKEQNHILNKQLAEIKLQKLLLYLSISFIFIVMILAFIIYKAYYSKKIVNKQLEIKNKEVINQKKQLEKNYKKIDDSIKYASFIQSAMLPSKKLISKSFPQHFILYKPKDIVSGDFYWVKQINKTIYFVAADCTGHGVPGAFMSMLGISFLNEIVRKSEVTKANLILEELRNHVKSSLQQTGEKHEQPDGMNIALCIIDTDTNKMQFAGANTPLFIIRNNKLLITIPDMNPVGIYFKEIPFNNHEIELETDDIIYLFSDGYVDQFGGTKQQKFTSKRFNKLLVDIHKKPMSEQKQILYDTIEKWRGNFEQIDDILVMGIKI